MNNPGYRGSSSSCKFGQPGQQYLQELAVVRTALLSPQLGWGLCAANLASEGNTPPLSLSSKTESKETLKKISQRHAFTFCYCHLSPILPLLLDKKKPRTPSAWYRAYLCRLEWELRDSCIGFYQSKTTRRDAEKRKKCSKQCWIRCLYGSLQMWRECSAELIKVAYFNKFQTYDRSNSKCIRL